MDRKRALFASLKAATAPIAPVDEPAPVEVIPEAPEAPKMPAKAPRVTVDAFERTKAPIVLPAPVPLAVDAPKLSERQAIMAAPRNTGRRGAKCKISPAIIDKICSAIADGAYAWVAARGAGISTFAYGDWLRRGDDPDEPDPIFAEFANRVEEARAQARSRVEQRVSIDHPIAWLTRGPGRDEGNPEQPGWLTEKQTLEVTGKDGRPIALAHLHAEVDLSRLEDGELELLETIYRKALPPSTAGSVAGDRDGEGPSSP